MRKGSSVLKALHEKKNLQLGIGFATGVLFGFLLQKGGVTTYDVIMGQLLLVDFTALKMMLSAMITGMVGVHGLRTLGMASLHPKPGAFGSVIPGGLIFGVGFGLLGYCPGTVAGAVGQGALDALFGGIAGILIGTGIFAAWFPKLEKAILNKGYFGELTWPQLLKTDPWWVVVPVVIAVTALLFWMERVGL
jgi:hypothetical protein